MGVPQFFHWLVTHYENELLSNKFPHSGKRPDILYLDFNCAIHPAVKGGDYATLDEMYEAVCRYLLKIIREIYKIPTDRSATSPDEMTVYIAVDGVAPMGKMKQQRYRRYKAVKDRSEMDSIDRKHQRYQPAKHDFNMISPGTEFMNGLTRSLNQFIATTLKQDYPHIKVIFDDASNPGEGEHKIMHHIRTATKPSDRVMVYGLDSDLIFLTLLHYRPYFCLFREQIHFTRDKKKDKDKDKATSSSSDEDDFTFLNLTTFRKILLAVMNPKMTKSKLNEWGILKPYQERLSEFKQEIFDIDTFSSPAPATATSIPQSSAYKPIPVVGSGQPSPSPSTSASLTSPPSNPQFISKQQTETLKDEMRKQDLEYINDVDGVDAIPDQLSVNLLIDYMVICIFLGNDFLPHIPSLKIKDGGLERVINSYKITQARLPNQTLVNSHNATATTTTMNAKFLYEYVRTLGDYEETDLTMQVEAMQVRLRKWKFRLFNMTDPYEKDVARWEYIEDQWQDKIQYGRANWKARYYGHYLQSTGIEESTRMVENYLMGLEWNLRYYLGNSVKDPAHTLETCPDWLWKYNYLVAPPVSDIFKYLQSNKPSLPQITYRGPVTTDVQLLLILPPQSSGLLKLELQGLMTSPDSPVSFQYPTDFKIDLHNHRFRWECYPILPPVDLKSTELAVKTILDPRLKQFPIRLPTPTEPKINIIPQVKQEIASTVKEVKEEPKKKLVFKKPLATLVEKPIEPIEASTETPSIISKKMTLKLKSKK